MPIYLAQLSYLSDDYNLGWTVKTYVELGANEIDAWIKGACKTFHQAYMNVANADVKLQGFRASDTEEYRDVLILDGSTLVAAPFSFTAAGAGTNATPVASVAVLVRGTRQEFLENTGVAQHWWLHGIDSDELETNGVAATFITAMKAPCDGFFQAFRKEATAKFEADTAPVPVQCSFAYPYVHRLGRPFSAAGLRNIRRRRAPVTP